MIKDEILRENVVPKYILQIVITFESDNRTQKKLGVTVTYNTGTVNKKFTQLCV